MTRRGTAGVFAAAALLLAGCATGTVATGEEDLRRTARNALEQRTIAPAEIESMFIERREVTSRGGVKVIGYNAWTRVTGCAEGYVVVQMSRLGSVEQVYGRDGCDPPGLD